MYRAVLTAALMTLSAAPAFASSCSPAGGLTPGGFIYATSQSAGGLDASQSTAYGVTTDINGVGIGGTISGGTLSFCFPNLAGVSPNVEITVSEASPLRDSNNHPIASFKFIVNGTPYTSQITYAISNDGLEDSSITATLDLALNAGVTYSLGIVDLIQIDPGSTFGPGNVPITGQYRGYSEVGISVQSLNDVDLPEPASLVLFGASLAGLASARRRRA